MPRRPYKKKENKEDPRYHSREVAKLINYVMRNGQRTVAERIVYAVLNRIKQNQLDPLEVIDKVIDNVAPHFEVRPKRVGGASYLVPVETRVSRKLFLAFNWLTEAARTRSSKEYKRFEKKLFAEIMDAYQGMGEAVAKRKQVEKLAEANKAFAHFKW